MQESLRFPDFIIGGAPKSGTSSLYFWLAAHPEVCGSRVKEPYFFGEKVNRFNEGCNYIENAIDDYAKYFAHCPPDKQAFEATAGYIYSENAIEGLQKLPTTPKVIFLLRSPGKQLLSHYKMERFRIQNTTLDFKDYIDLPRAQRLWTYSVHVAKWLKGYDRSKIKFILFEDLVRNKVKVSREIAAFLNIDSTFYDDFDFEHRNESRATKSKFLHKLGLRIQPLVPHAVQKALLPAYLALNSKKVPSSDQDYKSVLSSMKDDFNTEQQSLQQLLPELPISEFWND